jgi:predicted PurR-regulated permease PerM
MLYLWILCNFMPIFFIFALSKINYARTLMNQYSALKQALQPHLGWHGALNFVFSTVPTSFNQSQNRQFERTGSGIWK